MRIVKLNEVEYREIPGFQNYFISNAGVLLSMARDKRKLRPKLQEMAANGYMRASFRVSGRNVKRPVHRLVLLAWVGNPPAGKPQVNHKNGIKNDNRVGNLEWVSHAENQAHWREYLHEQVKGEFVRGSKLTAKDVKRMRAASQFLSTYELGRAFGVSRCSAARVIRGTTWKHVKLGVNAD